MSASYCYSCILIHGTGKLGCTEVNAIHLGIWPILDRGGLRSVKQQEASAFIGFQFQIKQDAAYVGS